MLPTTANKDAVAPRKILLRLIKLVAFLKKATKLLSLVMILEKHIFRGRKTFYYFREG